MLIHTGTRNFQCNRCNDSFTTKYSLEIHVKIIHEKKRDYVCNICEKNFSTSGNLTHHIASVHENQKNYQCSHCNNLFSKASSVETHIKTVHEKKRDYVCIECNESFTQSNNLTNHMERVHDNGKYECEFCRHNKNSQIEYCDIYGIHNICKTCYGTLSDKPVRIERKISTFLDGLPELFPFLIGSDKSFKTMGGCSRKRPDKLYSSSEIVVWLEVDEHQHYTSNGDYTCEEKRILDGFDEFVDGQQLVIIRFNPDGYTPPSGISKKTLSERLQLLRKIILQVLQNPPSEIIYVYYLFYNESNPHITKYIPNKLII
jgi:DNA-directed RNA polymerase subunit RPC12/RpoP